MPTRLVNWNLGVLVQVVLVLVWRLSVHIGACEGRLSLAISASEGDVLSLASSLSCLSGPLAEVALLLFEGAGNDPVRIMRTIFRSMLPSPANLTVVHDKVALVRAAQRTVPAFRNAAIAVVVRAGLQVCFAWRLQDRLAGRTKLKRIASRFTFLKLGLRHIRRSANAHGTNLPKNSTLFFADLLESFTPWPTS